MPSRQRIRLRQSGLHRLRPGISTFFRHRLGATAEDDIALRLLPRGLPQCQRKSTIPSNTRFYGGYYVGGGTPTRGAGRCIEDGTWGWDYSGILFPKRIALNWTAKGRYQGGTGTYKTDGPKLRHE